jgi:ABC-type uncharacterized transport system permease subunit
MLTFLFANMLLYSVPFIAAALGESVSQRAGVYNVGLEGYMLMGALLGYYGAHFSGSAWIGLLIGIVAGLLLSSVHAVLTVIYKADQIISGIAIWLIGLGLSSYIYQMFAVRSFITGFKPLDLGFLSDIPVVGPILFQQNILVYVVIIFTFIISKLLFSTPFGLRVQAVGDNPLAVDMAGKSVMKVRFISVLICGAMSGFAGSYISIGLLGFFSENITAGRGFIALCTVIFAGWMPWKVVLGAFLFSGIEAFQRYFQTLGTGVPMELLQITPYVLTIVVLVMIARKDNVPKQLGIPYSHG